MPIPEPGAREVLIHVEVCGVCRTDLHVVEGDLPAHRPNIIPGHEIVGTVTECGKDAHLFTVGDRIGVAWLGGTDGTCAYCLRGDENLCDHPTFSGYDVPGGYAEYTVAREEFAYPLPEKVSSQEAAPFLCACTIGYRSLKRSELSKGGTLSLAGIYMTPIPEMDYGRYLFQEHTLRSVTANTRQDGRDLLSLAQEIPLNTQTQAFPTGRRQHGPSGAQARSDQRCSGAPNRIMNSRDNCFTTTELFLTNTSPIID